MLTDEQISHMADRFCGWPIPKNWNPDGGISYEPFGNKGTPREYKRDTSGTNLFSKQQAEEMIRYMIDGMQSTRKPPADTIAVPREVLMGVRELLQKLTAYIENGKWDEEYGYPRMIKDSLASLDAVLSEGE